MVKTGGLNRYILFAVGALTLGSTLIGCSGAGPSAAGTSNDDLTGGTGGGSYTESGGGWSSGGGNGVVCFDNAAIADAVRRNQHQVSAAQIAHATSVESVDFLEAKLPQGLDGHQPEIVPYHAGESASQYLAKVASRFERSVPRLSEFIQDGMKAFQEQNLKYQNVGVPFIDDANLMAEYDRGNCTLVTLARQFQISDTYVLRIDNRLAQKMSEQSRAVLILHELLYRTARLKGQKDSRNTRLLLGAMITQNDGRTVEQMVKLGANLGFLENSYKETYYQWLVRKFTLRALRYAQSLYVPVHGEDDYSYFATDEELRKSGYNPTDPAFIQERDRVRREIGERAKRLDAEMTKYLFGAEFVGDIRKEFSIFPAKLAQKAEDTLGQIHPLVSNFSTAALYWDVTLTENGHSVRTMGAQNVLGFYLDPLRVEMFHPEIHDSLVASPDHPVAPSYTAGICLSSKASVPRSEIKLQGWFNEGPISAELSDEKRSSNCSVQIDFLEMLDSFSSFLTPTDAGDLSYPIPSAT